MNKDELIAVLQHQRAVYKQTLLEKLSYYGCEMSKTADENSLMDSFQGSLNKPATSFTAQTSPTKSASKILFDTQSINQISSIKDKIALLRGAGS